MFGGVHGILVFSSEIANNSILVFGAEFATGENLATQSPISTNGNLQLTSEYQSLTLEAQKVQQLIFDFEHKYGELSNHLTIKFITKNPLFQSGP